MKKTITLTLLLAVFSFACTKKLEINDYFQCPYLLVNIDYTNIEGDFSNIEHWKKPVKKYRNNGSSRMYYSENDSNIIVFIASIANAPDKGVAMYMIRACQTEEECIKQSREHDIIETFKYEFMRFQREGAYATTLEYADSVSNKIASKLRNFYQVLPDSIKTIDYDAIDSIYPYISYNTQYCFTDEYYFNDDVEKEYCKLYPNELIEELDSCNASLEPEPIIKNRVSINKNFNIEVENNIIHISGYSITPTEISIVSPIGKVLERHHINSQSSSIRTNLPKGNYLAVIKFKNGQPLQKIIKITR